VDPYRNKSDAPRDTLTDPITSRSGSTAMTKCPTCGFVIVAEGGPIALSSAVLAHADECDGGGAAIKVECINDDSPGPYMIEVVSPGRAMRATVTFKGDGEISAVASWCRSRWRAPARIAKLSISFAS
jgi:hypothetical protein